MTLTLINLLCFYCCKVGCDPTILKYPKHCFCISFGFSKTWIDLCLDVMSQLIVEKGISYCLCLYLLSKFSFISEYKKKLEDAIQNDTSGHFGRLLISLAQVQL